jgi:hypothetical protein
MFAVSEFYNDAANEPDFNIKEEHQGRLQVLEHGDCYDSQGVRLQD